jgi:light-harvesting complex 1 beta chain
MANIQNALHKPMVGDDTKSFWVIFVLSYPVLLAIALIGQLLGWHWRSWLPGAEGVDSLFGGVKAAVYTFMSHLL